MERIDDELATAFDELEDAVCAYLHEAHNETLADIIDCDHNAGVCWCGYKKSYENLLVALRRKSEIKLQSPLDLRCSS